MSNIPGAELRARNIHRLHGEFRPVLDRFLAASRDVGYSDEEIAKAILAALLERGIEVNLS